MAEQVLRIKTPNEATTKISKITIKHNIKKYMNNRDINLFDLSNSTDINIFILIYLIYYPFSKIKMSNSFEICKALNLQVSELLE